MLKSIKKTTCKKGSELSNKRMKDVFKSSGRVILGMAQTAACIAICFAFVELRNKENQLHESQTIIESEHYNDEYKNTNKNLKNFLKVTVKRSSV